jgi:glycosyltransferase involved in cell wall biosynthesis
MKTNTRIHSIIIATHSFSPGTSQGLRDYCRRRKLPYLYIEHPLFGNLFSWAIGLFDTLLKVILTGKKYDLYVGSNRLNAFAGIILKKLGRVNKTVYFSPDWSKNRFNNRLLNYFFQKLDYFCVKYSDLVWNSSTVMDIDPMMREREKLGYSKAWRKKQIQVADGTDFFPVPNFNQINRYEIGFVGHLKKEMGVQLAIDSLPEIIKKIPQIKLLIIGSGPIEDKLRQKAKGLNVGFTGFMGEINKVYEKLSQCAIAIAPYQETKENISQYSDPGKTKNYFSVGLPIIITKVPKIAYEIDKEKCGIVISYNKKDFIQAVIKLLGNEETLKQYRRNVLKLRKKYSWDAIFNRALKITDSL